MIDLDHAERQFRHPASAAGNNELALALIEELRALRTVPIAVPARVEAPADVAHDAPTPPMGIVIDDRPEPRKKGKR